MNAAATAVIIAEECQLVLPKRTPIFERRFFGGRVGRNAYRCPKHVFFAERFRSDMTAAGTAGAKQPT